MRERNEPNPNRAPWVSADSSPAGLGNAANPAPFNPFDSDLQNTQGKKRGWGCWVWGCLGVIVFMLIAIIGVGVTSYFVYTAQVNKYTDTQPAELPVVEMQADELETLEKRIESFTNQVRPQDETLADAGAATKSDAATEGSATTDEPGETAADAADRGDLAGKDATGPPARELVLTANEINGLIAANPDMRGRVFVKIKDGVVSGQVSIPTTMIPGASDRFFNADAEFDVSMKDGILVVQLTDASVKGERIPQQLLDGMSDENLAKGLYDDPKNAEMLRKFESIEVLDDSILLKLREPKVTQEPETDSKLDPGTASESGVEPETQPTLDADSDA